MAKITKIKIKNLYGITELELGPGSKELSGSNGTGKSSVLDAIRLAITNKSDRKYVIHNGATEGEIIIETDSGLNIDRKKRTTQSDYKSVKQNGKDVGSPEAFLRGIITPLQLNPIDFMEMTEREQNRIILDMIEYDWSLDTIKEWFGELPDWVNYEQNILAVLGDLQSDTGKWFTDRTDLNREARFQADAVAKIRAKLPFDYDGSVWEKVSLSDTYTEIERRRRNNQEIEKAQLFLKTQANKIRGFEANRDVALAALDREFTQKEQNINKRLLELKAEWDALKKESAGLSDTKADKAAVIHAKYDADVAELNSKLAEYQELAEGEILPTEDLEKQAYETEQMKSYVREWERANAQEQAVVELKEKAEVLTKKIEKARSLPGEILEQATIPIAGLTVKDGIPLINGLPISNLSSGEKLDLCIDVACQNPAGLQIVLMDGVEALSDELRESVYAKCKSKGIQFIATRTTNDSELMITEL